MITRSSWAMGSLLFAALGCSPRASTTAPADLAADGGIGDCSDAGVGDCSDAGVGDSSDAAASGPYDLGASAPPSAHIPPANGVLLGAFVGVGSNDTPDFLAEEQLISRRWVIDNRFYSYEDWINDRTRWDIAQKKLPLITWEPHEPLDEIIAGTHDAVFHQRAQGARDLGVDILLRWGHEMNGNWYPWAGANKGGANGGSAKYIAAYRHVHDLFVADGATNVAWVWCPLVADVPSEAWNHWTNY
ncbi:MAG: glycoside hydrolase family 26, partial [bacterium]|nr:glycoside hydrolase family 26 [bacterium]